MAREPSQKLVDYGIIAGIALAGYAVWTMFFKKEAPKECPPGQHPVNPCEGQIGWPAFFCNAGRNITGAFLDCKPNVPVIVPCTDVGGAKCKSEGGTWKDAPDCVCTGSKPPGNLNCECSPGQSELCVSTGGTWHECMDDRITPRCECVYPLPVVLPRDEHGCLVGNQHYCGAPDHKCRDAAQHCTPLTGKPGDCYEWDVLSGRWIYSPSIPGCGIITCPDGSQHYKVNCPVIVDPCPASECIPTSTICIDGIPKVCVEGGVGCRDRGIWSPGGNACKPKTNIVNCPGCGLIDLANTPDGHMGTCAELCKPMPKTCDWNCAQPACNSINFTGAYIQFAGGTQAGCESHGAYYHEGNSWGTCWNRAAQRQKDCFKDCGC
jgi:hypothetical protein